MSTATGEMSGRLLEMYRDTLERKIQQGYWSPVCRDEELSSEVEGLLSKGSYDTHSQRGLDPLSVMETSLQALPVTSGQAGLGRLAKAFEVLELAAINLYLFPWRKEYRVVKMFSGMFTHCIKPALTSLQAKELFGLLGYVPGGAGEEEQLKLGSTAPPAGALLQLACAFFTAAVECRLLLSAAPSLGSGVEGELRLVQERRHGHCLEVALERARRELEAALQTSKHETSDLDIYTDEDPKSVWKPENDHMTAPPNYPYIPPEEIPSPRMSHGNCSQSERVSDESSGKAQTVCASTMTYRISPKPQVSPTQKTESGQKPTKTSDKEKMALDSQPNVSRREKGVCSCSKSYDLSAHRSLQCKDVHSVDCPEIRICRGQGHDVYDVQQRRGDELSYDSSQSSEKPPKDALKTHGCVSNSRANVFVVCHNCHIIHDFLCDDFRRCQGLRHNVQSTGMLQTPQGEGTATPSPERHLCLSTEAPVYVVCHTCNKSHDYLCKETQVCQRADHVVKYLVELNKEPPSAPTATPTPMPLHACCGSSKPDFACLSCKVFHARSCDEQCLINHKIQGLSHVCTKCAGAEVYTLCKYCCLQYCKACWFKSPINCKCGMFFDSYV